MTIKPATSTTPVTSSAVKKDIQKLQRAVVDGLEDVKAQDIVVFDTEALSSLFERVVIASGTPNRQTKALASSVIDAVRAAGFAKPRIEGEGNGEWIIVDCGAAVVHIMQPNFRTYYNLEELWGEKPVRLKLGAAKPTPVKSSKPAEAVNAISKPASSLRRSSAAKKGIDEAFPTKAMMKKAQLAAEKAAKPATGKKPVAAGKQRIKTLVVNAPTKPAGKAAVAKRAPAKKVTRRA